jgi:allantoicase
MIEGISAPGARADEVLPRTGWREILPRTKLQPHTRHFYDEELVDRGPFTHVRLNIYPDGGVSRLRLWGAITREGGIGRRLERFRTLLREEAEAELLACCGSRAWAAQMADRRPFATLDEVLEAADSIWRSLGEGEWLEAFKAHPRIGEKKAEAAQDARAKAWSEKEQSGVAAASEETLAALAEGNRAYDAKFGHIFLICATGKSADEMLASLRARLGNDPAEEKRIAAEEQRKITSLRLEKLFT